MHMRSIFQNIYTRTCLLIWITYYSFFINYHYLLQTRTQSQRFIYYAWRCRLILARNIEVNWVKMVSKLGQDTLASISLTDFHSCQTQMDNNGISLQLMYNTWTINDVLNSNCWNTRAKKNCIMILFMIQRTAIIGREINKFEAG